MGQDNKDIFNRFNEVLGKLSPETRKNLYEHLKTLSPEERNKAVYAIVKKYDDTRAKADVNQSIDPDNKIKIERQEVSSKIDTGNIEIKNEKVEPRKIEKKPETNQVPKTKKHLKKGVKVFIGVVIAALVLIIGSVIGFMNKDAIKAKLGMNPAEITTVASDETTIPSEDIIETTEVSETSEVVPEETTPSPTPAPTNVPLADNAPNLDGMTIVIDPGHQEVADEETENCATWLSISKPRCTAGAVGVSTGVCEYDLTLQYSLAVANYLEQCGATVILTRDSNDVNISNQERAQIAVDNNAIFIRIHADSANDSMASGVRVYVPDSGSWTATNESMGEQLGNLVADAEGMDFDGVVSTYLYTGLNYANTVPAYQISLGFLSNSDNEAILVDEGNQVSVAQAIAEFCALLNV